MTMIELAKEYKRLIEAKHFKQAGLIMKQMVSAIGYHATVHLLEITSK